MNQKVMKTLAGFAVLFMVFSVIPSSALAAEIDAQDDGENAVGPFKQRVGGLFKGMNANGQIMERPANMERPQLTDEERTDFMQTKMLDMIDRQIERLVNIDIEDIDDETITSDMIDEWISQLNAIRDSIDVEDITTDQLQASGNELHELMQEICSSGICGGICEPMGHRFCSMQE